MRLKRAVDDFHQHVGRVELDERDLLAGRLRSFTVDLPGSLQHHQAGCVNLGATLGDPVLDRLPVSQLVAR